MERRKLDETYAFVSGFLRITAVKTSTKQLSPVASFELQPSSPRNLSFELQPSKSRKLSFRQWLPSNYSRQNVKITALLQPSKRQKHSFRQWLPSNYSRQDQKTKVFVSGFLRITAVKTSKAQLSVVASFELQPSRPERPERPERE